MKKYIYYAHHLYKYDTKIEEYEINLITKKFPGLTTLNPNGDIIHEDLTNDEKIMSKCLSDVARNDVDAVVFSSISGVVGKGVHDEVSHAQKLGKKVYYINNNEIHLCSNIVFDIINESRRIYAVVKQYR